MPASIPFKPKFSLCLTPARASSSTTPPHDRRGIRIKISPHPLRSLRLKSKISNFSVRLGLAVARLARVPMGCEHPQGAVTRLWTSTKKRQALAPWGMQPNTSFQIFLMLYCSFGSLSTPFFMLYIVTF